MGVTVLSRVDRFEPSISILCKIPVNAIGRGEGFYLNVYYPEPLIDIKCNLCPPGTHWDEECGDCVCDNISILLGLAQAIRGDLDGLRLRSSSTGTNGNSQSVKRT